MSRTYSPPVLTICLVIIKERGLAGELLPKSKFHQTLNYYLSLAPHFKNLSQPPPMPDWITTSLSGPSALDHRTQKTGCSLAAKTAAGPVRSCSSWCRPAETWASIRKTTLKMFAPHHGTPARRIHEMLPDRWLAAKQKDAAIHSPDQDGVS